MTKVVDDIREIVHVGDLFKHTFPSSMEDGTTIDAYYQVFGVTKKSVKVAKVEVPANYDFSKKELLEPYTYSYYDKTYSNKKVKQSVFGDTYIIMSQTCYDLVKWFIVNIHRDVLGRPHLISIKLANNYIGPDLETS